MSNQMIFKRYELKYLLTLEQKERLLLTMEPYMALDQYGHSIIRNIYFDTENFRLARRSIEQPAYKEKLRVRSYCRPRPEDSVFVELKKKYQSVVYKRRLVLPEGQAMNWLCGKEASIPASQIAAETEYFRQYYQTLQPAVFLSYEREAFYSKAGDEFRVTFDENILAREEELSLNSETWGTLLMDEGLVLMEIKTPGGIPLWMSHFLTWNRLYKTSFSKYGTAYKTMIYPVYEGGKKYA